MTRADIETISDLKAEIKFLQKENQQLKDELQVFQAREAEQKEKRRETARKAVATRKRREAAQKAVATRKRRAAARKAVATRQQTSG